MNRLLIFLAVFASAALASDITGSWKATAPGPNGPMERTFIFQVAGDDLTGQTTSSVLGTSAIENGKIDGDSLTFTITVMLQNRETKLIYRGRVAGEVIRLTADTPGGGPKVQWTARRVS